MKSLKSLNENAYYTNYTILSHIKFFFYKVFVHKILFICVYKNFEPL